MKRPANSEPPTSQPYYGVFDLFKIGIGPSSSHSVGPMKAAGTFVNELKTLGQLRDVARIRVDLYGSLALTGLGHGTDIAVLLGLSGELPEEIDPASIATKVEQIRSTGKLILRDEHEIKFTEQNDLIFNRRESLKAHPNGMRFQAFVAPDSQTALYSNTYFSIGGGFVVPEAQFGQIPASTEAFVPFPFATAAELLAHADQQQLSISQLMLENEKTFRSPDVIHQLLCRIWQVMQTCVQRGVTITGTLPGGLGVRRRAPAFYESLQSRPTSRYSDPMAAMDWVNLYALAVSEENAAGGRVVTAPTNGAAGIIPAVMHYCQRFYAPPSDTWVDQFLLTAAAIGSLYKRNASISGAEVGCQGEVGVACSMAAAALTDVLGGTVRQVEEAAEIGMEHNLGLTCDPIKGLVQIPCIERNAMGAVKAINASRLALRGDGKHFVSLDRVIRVMKQTGADMSSRYKETSRGGLAVNFSEC